MVKKSFHTASGQSGSFEFSFFLIPPFYFLKWNCYFLVCERKFAKFFMSFWKAQVSFPSNSESIFSAIKNNSSALSLVHTLYTLVKSSPLKCNFLSFSSSQVKFCQIPHVSFELASQFLFKSCIILNCYDTKLPCKP